VFALDLAAHVKQCPATTVLTNELGQHLGPWALERAVRAARIAVDGLPDGFRYHDLRHSLASLLIESGADVKTVQGAAAARLGEDDAGHLPAPLADSDESTRTAVERSCPRVLRTLCGPARRRH
jgi:integrase